MKPAQVKDVVHQHSLWLANKSTGKQADFTGRVLYCVSFNGADLQGAIFAGADLQCVSFRYANLIDADFTSANLQDVNFAMAKLDGCYFRDANIERPYGVKWAECAFTSHGEMGRRLLAIMINNKPMYFCGCFDGDEAALRKYIADDGCKEYRPSRLFALEFVKNAIDKTFNEETGQ